MPLPQIDDIGGIPVYSSCSQPGFCVGGGFFIVIEAKPGSSGAQPSVQTVSSPGRPGFQIEANHNLGNGSAAVCDVAGPQPTQTPGGVPAVDPPNFDSTCAMTPPVLCQEITDALNDFGCRFIDSTSDPCTFNGMRYAHVMLDSTKQLCALVSTDWSFPRGDTLLTARWLDQDGNASLPKSIFVRVQ